MDGHVNKVRFTIQIFQIFSFQILFQGVSYLLAKIP